MWGGDGVGFGWGGVGGDGGCAVFHVGVIGGGVVNAVWLDGLAVVISYGVFDDFAFVFVTTVCAAPGK